MNCNKKIKNATTVEYAGISFRSTSEKNMYKKLISLGITPEYEPDHFILLEKITPSKAWYIDGIPVNTKSKNPETGKMDILTDKPQSLQDWEYTPDFKIKMGDLIFYIEAKGFPNDLWPYKRKMFLHYIQKLPNTYFFEVHSTRGLLTSVEVMKKLYETSTTRNN